MSGARRARDPQEMAGRVCLVTGGNRGIGWQVALGLADRGATVVIVGRDRRRGREAREEIRLKTGNDAVELMVADLAVQRQVRELAARFEERFDALHVLVNNAGIVARERSLTPDGIESTLAVNHLAPFLLTHELLDLMERTGGARIVNVSSEAHRRAELDLDDLQLEDDWDALLAYANSKLCNILFTRELARRLQGTDIIANSMHPGLIRTGLVDDYVANMGWWARVARPLLLPLITSGPEDGARTAVWLAVSPRLDGVSGRYFVDRERREPSPAATDRQTALELWQLSARAVGLADAA